MPGFRGLTVKKLGRILGCSSDRLHALQRRSDEEYRRTQIDTGQKVRTLSIPSPELKALQRDLLDKLFYRLNPPDCLGHVRGKGVVWTLDRHQKHPALFHADIRDFFPSVSRRRVEESLVGLKVRPNAAAMIADLVTYDDELPQGAPTSVAVGDMVLFLVDRRIEGLAEQHGLTYTRYVDDLTLSGRVALVERFHRDVVDFLEDDGWRLSEKGGVFGPSERHQVLNAVVNAKPNVTSEYYRSVRDELRSIARFGRRPSSAEMDSLAAKVVWIATVNPDRHDSLLRLLTEALDRSQLGRVA